MDARLTPKAQKQMEEVFQLRAQAVDLLALVVAEWNSDPMSVQCFDSAIVDQAKRVIARLKETDVFM